MSIDRRQQSAGAEPDNWCCLVLGTRPDRCTKRRQRDCRDTAFMPTIATWSGADRLELTSCSLIPVQESIIALEGRASTTCPPCGATHIHMLPGLGRRQRPAPDLHSAVLFQPSCCKHALLGVAGYCQHRRTVSIAWVTGSRSSHDLLDYLQLTRSQSFNRGRGVAHIASTQLCHSTMAACRRHAQTMSPGPGQARHCHLLPWAARFL